MRVSRRDVASATHSVPDVRFEEQELTSFAGLVLFLAIARRIKLRARLRRCSAHLAGRHGYCPSRLILILIVHMFLGWRRLRDLDYYRDDPLVLRTVGLRRLPDVSTVSRRLGDFDEKVVDNLRGMLRDLVGTRAISASPSRLTLDFDGSVQSTKARGIEGTAVGYNTRKKGARSYYPLFATIAQTGHAFDVLHRPGNRHDSRNAVEFVAECCRELREAGFTGVLEARFDGAHYSDRMCEWLHSNRVEFSMSVPFERLPTLKAAVEERRVWKRIDDEWSYFKRMWRPNERSARPFLCFVFRRRVRKPRKGPIQLDLFEPVDHEHEYKVVMTNKSVKAKALLLFHNGRGTQEGIFAELKSQVSMEYLPSRRLVANQTYLLSGLLAHAIAREIQMSADEPRVSVNTPTRACLWFVEQLGTLRKRVIQRAARLTRPAGKLVLILARNDAVADDYERLLRPWRRRAA